MKRFRVDFSNGQLSEKIKERVKERKEKLHLQGPIPYENSPIEKSSTQPTDALHEQSDSKIISVSNSLSDRLATGISSLAPNRR